MTMTLIQTVTAVGATTLSLEFSSIPQTYTDLVLVASLRSSNDRFLSLRFNSSTTGFTNKQLVGEGSTINNQNRTDTFVGYISNYQDTAATFANTSIYVPNYAGSTNKTFLIDTVSENNATTAYQGIVAGLWSNTAAITSIQLFILASNGYMVADSSASLYGITKGSDGIVTTS